MRKKWQTWFKGAVIGLVIALIISIGIGTDIRMLNQLASPGILSCQLLTECSNCIACDIIGMMLNSIYGFLIGALIGLIIDKIRPKKSKKK